MTKIETNTNFDNCFVCSPTNPIGLHLHVDWADGKASTEMVPHENMSGLTGLMHGGFSMMVLSEVMYYATKSCGVENNVTLNMSCDFLNPAITGHKLKAEARVEKQDRKKFFLSAELKDADDNNKILVKSEGLFYAIDMSAAANQDGK